MPTRDFAQDLRSTAERARATLQEMPPERAARKPAPEKWSPAQIVGHLIDSASNNHGRFVRAHFVPDLRFDGYEQELWVAAQEYATAPWPEIVTLWATLNLHLARIMESVPDDVLKRPRPDHNLDRLAWEAVPAAEPVTLEYFMRDYVGHLKHHLRQIDPTLAEAPALQRRGKPHPPGAAVPTI